MFEIAQARPPFVEFKQVPKHDPKRSEEVGYRVTKDVDMAFIRCPGSKDCLEIKATDWLDQIRRKLLDNAHDAFPQEWVDGFRKKYEAWKAGQDMPLNGTSVKEWPVLSPAQAQNFIALNILTIEDVAAMTEEAMQRFGMGSRELRDKAREWIKTATLAKTAIHENEELKKEVAELKAKIAEFMASQPAKRGRKPKEE